ncbi:uncharacterized protein RSE6_02792 [Rhynchosporium secalis]|uniref:Uncharacterized protein n=1 Tax=Rhynchosporium secalis TaxID=38038 RepID=A0A1E1M149_RHYSE|nr:uncharacterized protein RSE6_02792 [Rhynchosporium secalis]
MAKIPSLYLLRRLSTMDNSDGVDEVWSSLDSALTHRCDCFSEHTYESLWCDDLKKSSIPGNFVKQLASILIVIFIPMAMVGASQSA